MQRNEKLYLSICDYNKNVVCDLYDNQSDISGQATDVVIVKERNGWKELTFNIPSSCMGENGLEENYRINYLIAEYRIKAVTDDETDWFIISEPQISHSGFSKNVSVKAGHISKTLKNKNMDLEFSDDEGNNVGTAEQLLTTILEGTGWHVGNVEVFTEDDGSVKSRSISGQAGSGALSFIEQLCDAFNAKPIYHGDTQTVDIVAMNPFNKIDPEQIPYELVESEEILELTYNRNTHNLSKTANTDNMATRLYAYGSSGDLNGICSLQTAEHSEYQFTVTTTGNEYCFEDLSGKRHFFTGNVSSGNVLIYSDLDLTSQLYIWNNSKEKAYPLYDKPVGTYVTLTNPSYFVRKNYFPYLLGLQYYYEVGLMSDLQLQQVAKFQRDLPILYQASQESAQAYIEGEQELSKIAEHNTGLLKLKIQQRSLDNGYVKLTIDTSENKGIIYRTDYDVTERKYFQWHVAKKLQENGDPTSGTPSVLLVVHDTNPITWDKVYLKTVYNNDLVKVVDENGDPTDFKYSTGGFPTAITVWSTDLRWSTSDRVYLFCTNSMSGLLGARMSEDEAVIENLYNKTEKHPTQFWDADSNIQRPSPQGAEYEWLYAYHKNPAIVGTFYFCWKTKGDTVWRNVFIQDTVPNVQNNAYFYNLKYKTLWHGESGSWVKCGSAAEQRVADNFSKVFYYCRRRDMLYKGLYEYYTHACVNLPAGNYAIPTDFAFYFTFKTDSRTTSSLKLDTVHGYVIPDGNIANVSTISTIPYETVTYPIENEIEDKVFYLGTINISNGTEQDSKTIYRTGTVKVYESKQYDYNLPSNCSVCFYDINLKFISGMAVGGSGSFTTPPRTRYIRLVSPQQQVNGYVRLSTYNSQIYYNEEFYTVLSPVNPSTGQNELIGINPLMEKFADLADQTYSEYLVTMQTSQEAIRTFTNNLTESLSDMIKDGRWQDSNYVAGDEKRLYQDAMDMHKQISMPEINYSFTYLEMFGVHNAHYYEEHETTWPKIDITYMAHLLDTEINTNCWAYMDRILKCYDKPWQTNIEIDTKLTLAARHGFTDVIARIAEVAKEISSKKSEFDEAFSGTITGSRLEGMIRLNQAYLDGGSSNWHTDEKGNIIFLASDGLSAMLLGGRGLGVANSKNEDGTWQWRSAVTGYGITADEITTGYLDADRIAARSISVDKLMSNVGQELEISSNKALTLFATEDGSRPAGTLLTTDAIISIQAGYTDENQNVVPAVIDVKSGGELNLVGGVVNITSNGELNVESSGTFTLKSKGAGLNTTTDGLYIGSDGVNLGGGKFKVTFSGNTSTVYIDAGNVQIGNTSSETLQSSLDSKTQTFRKTAAQIVLEQYRVGDRWTDTGSTYLYTYQCITVSNPRNSTTDWQLERTAITKGAALDVDAVNGTIDMVASNTITISAGASINIASGQSLTLTSSGKVLIGNTGKAFTIGSNGTNAYIYNGLSSLTGTDNGVYLGTDGFYIRGTSNNVTHYVKATAQGVIDISGKITSAEGSIGTWTIGSDYLGNNSTKNTSTVGMANAQSNKVFWAGGTYNGTGNNTPKFYVKDDGTLYTVKGTVGGWSLGTDYIGNANTKNGSTVGIANASGSNIVFWAGGAYNGTGNNAPEFKVTADGKLTATGADIKGTIRASTLYIGDQQANISLDNNGHITIGSIGGTFSVKLSDVTFDHLGQQSASNIYMTPTLFQVGVNGDGIKIDNNGVSVSGSRSINLDVNSNNYVHLSSSGIVMKGSRVTIMDASTGEQSTMWGRDDIIVMNTRANNWRNSIASIEQHMAGKSDWVLIRPYYNAQIRHAGQTPLDWSQQIELYYDVNEAFGDEAEGYAYDLQIITTRNNQYRPALEVAIWSVVNGTTKKITLTDFTVNGTNVGVSSDQGYDIHVPLDNGVDDGNSITYNLTFTARGTGSNYNLCSEGHQMFARVYFRTYDGNRPTMKTLSVTARCNASTTRVPCTVYYYPQTQGVL